MLEIRYTWEWPVRIVHWVNVLCIVVLCFTGFAIGTPFIAPAGNAPYVMGWIRFIHFVFAYLFTVACLSRLLWAFIGNHHASWKAFFPLFNAEGRKSALKMFKYYTFIGKKISYEVGHNAMAAMIYLVVYLLFAVQIATGFALYSQYSPSGLWHTLAGPLLQLVGNQNLRLVHHGVMWLLIGFVINHIYSAWLMDVKERNGTISGIFSGYKYIEPKDL